MRVLIVEDSQDLAANICDYLEERGFVVDYAADGLTGLHLAIKEDFAAIVLDLGLPGIDGLEVCRALREKAQNPTPIVMLTARDTLEDRLVGFEHGADDYIVKPFSLKELVARIGAVVRRSQGRVGSPVLAVGDLVLDLDRMEARRGDVTLRLSRTELRILEELMRSKGKVVTREVLEEGVWGDDPPVSDALKTHIYNLRQAIDKPFGSPLLATVHGIGYRLEDPDHGNV